MPESGKEACSCPALLDDFVVEPILIDVVGVEGYNKVRLNGKVIYGQAWVDVTKDNMGEYKF